MDEKTVFENRLSDADKQLLSLKFEVLKTVRLKKKEIEEIEEAQKEELLQLFKSLNLQSYSSNDVFVRYNAPGVTTKINSKKLKEELPDVYNSYVITSSRKEFLSVKVREDDDAKFLEKYYSEED